MPVKQILAVFIGEMSCFFVVVVCTLRGHVIQILNSFEFRFIGGLAGWDMTREVLS